MLPRLVRGDVAVGAIGERRDLAHGAADIAALVELGEFDARFGNDAPQLLVVRTRGQHAAEVFADEVRRAGGDVHHLAHQVRVHALHEIRQVDVHVVHSRRDFRGEVVAQVFGIQMVQISGGVDERAAGFRHLLAVHGDVAVRVNAGGRAEARVREHRRPEQAMEVHDVLADEVMHFGIALRVPKVVEREAVDALAQIAKTRHVADRRVHPNIEELAFGTGNGKAEIRRVAADVPRLEATVEPLGKFVRHFRLHRAACRPLLQKIGEAGQVHEIVFGLAQLRRGVRQHRARRTQIHRIVSGAALVAVVARLILRAAARAFAAHLAIGKKETALGIVELFHIRGEGVAAFAQTTVHQACVVFVLGGMRGVVVVVADVETPEVRRVFAAQPVDQGFRRDAFALREQHRRGAVRVVRAHIVAFVANHALKAHENVGLDVLEQVSEMDCAVGVRQRAGDQNAAHGLNSRCEVNRRGGTRVIVAPPARSGGRRYRSGVRIAGMRSAPGNHIRNAAGIPQATLMSRMRAAGATPCPVLQSNRTPSCR